MAALALVPPSVQLSALWRGERLASTPSSTKPAPKNRRKKRKPAHKKKKRGGRQRGSVANVHWRAIPARALRSHPLYLGLPPARDVCQGAGGRPR